MIEENRPDLILMDVHLEGTVDGISTANLIRVRWNIPLVFVTANTDEQVIARAETAGAFGFLTKPFRTDELNATIRVALDRHRMTQALFEEHAWFTTMLGSLSDGIIASDRDGYVRYLNPTAEALLGWGLQHAQGQPIEQIYRLTKPDNSPIDRIPLRVVVETKAPIGKQRFCLASKDGIAVMVEDATAPILAHGEVLGAVTIVQNISAREDAEHALRQSEKLAVVGRLASSIAHEINNPLEAITNLLYIAELQLASDSPVLECIQRANLELARIAEITTETLKFHRQSTGPTEVQLNSVLESVLKLHEARTRSLQVRVDRRYRECDRFTGFANEIRQVLANLITNALDAMSTSSDRRLSVRLRSATNWRNGRDGVRITIADTGCGLSPEAKKQIYTPFFTTKSSTGTGLGLWVSAGIIEKHAGNIRFRSRRVGRYRGTVFAVFLPARNS